MHGAEHRQRSVVNFSKWLAMIFVMLFVSAMALSGCDKWSGSLPEPMLFFPPDGRVTMARQIANISDPPEMAGWGYQFFGWEISGKESDISSEVSAETIHSYHVWSSASSSEPCRLGIEAGKKWEDYRKIAPSVDSILKSDDALVCFESYHRNKIDEKLEVWMWLCSPKQKLIVYVGVKE